MHSKSYYSVADPINRMWNLFMELIAWIDGLPFLKGRNVTQLCF